MSNNLYADTCGVLIGLASIPSDMNEIEFFDTHIKKELSEHYREEREKYMLKKKPYYMKGIYEPWGYKTFGDNNLMFLSLFDDFAYPNRVFHPFHGSRNEGTEYRNYDYQLVVGLNIMTRKDNEAQNILDEQTLKNRLCSEKINIYPFACVTRMKINSALLSGTGLELIELIKNKLYKIAKDLDIYTLILNGVGSDELIVINFTKKISQFMDIVCRYRNLQAKDLNWEECKRIRTVVTKTIENYDWESAHLFTSTYSLSGYAINIDKQSTSLELYNEDIYFTFSWDIKPGHILNFLNEYDENIENLGIESKQKFWHASSSMWRCTIGLKELQQKQCNFFDVMDRLRNLDINKIHTRKLHISILQENLDENYIENIVNPIDINTHPCTKSIFPYYTFNSDFLMALRDNLNKSKISKVLKERVMKMYHNYNDCIQDPVFFTTFIGLKHFLVFFANTIQNYVKEDNTIQADELQDWMDNSIRDFEQAYLNRFHQSSRTRTLSDFNLEWNGGIQQLISSMDFTYKMFMRLCGAKLLNKFIYVTGYERVHVTDHSYKINMQHITYPELFVSTMWKEMFNFLMDMATSKDQTGQIPFKIYCSENFIHKLKEKIALHYLFNHANRVHQTFLHMLDKEYMVSIVADTMALYYGYRKDWSLFSCWYWRYLMQSSMYHNINGEINKERFILFFSRILFAKMIVDGQIDDIQFAPYDACIAEYWTKYFKDVSIIVKLLYNELIKKDFKDIVEDVTYKMLINTFEDYKNYMDEKTANNEKSINKVKGIINIIDTDRSETQEQYIQYFKDKELPLELNDKQYYYICSFLPAFLKYLKELDMKDCDGEVSHTLQRTKEGKPDLDINLAKYYSNILSDTLGGTFCIHSEVQGEYFAARSIFYMASFDFYERHLVNTIK